MFLQNLRARLGARLSGDSEAGFTLIELLVVMLILGILAAIALPAFFNQRDKAGDAKAKENAHSAQVAMETYATENGGSYLNASETALNAIEPTIKLGVVGEPEASTPVPAKEGIVTTNTTASGYEVISVSSTGNLFKIVNTSGKMTFPCEIPKVGANAGGCPGIESGKKVGNWENG